MSQLEELVIKMPGVDGAEIELNWEGCSLEEIDLGNPPERDEYVSGTDSDGAPPARIARRDNREPGCRIRPLDALDKDDVTERIAEIEAALMTARRVAAAGPTDPIDYVRLIYTPADGNAEFFLPIFGGEITDIPKKVEGDDAGWFLNMPPIVLKFVCDPFGYGELEDYLDTTTAGGERVATMTIAGGRGDVPPWLRASVEDVAAVSRSKVILAVKENEPATSGEVLATAMTTAGYSGTVAGGYLGAILTEWSVIAKFPQQTRRGNFRIMLTELTGLGQVRVHYAEASGSRKPSSAIFAPYGAKGDRVADLDISVDTDWDVWIEAIGVVSLFSALIIPTDHYMEAVSAGIGSQLAGELKVADALTGTTATIHGTSLTTGAGTWDTGGDTWAETSSGASRTSTSMGSPLQAKAGSTTIGDVEMKASFCPIGGSLTEDTTVPLTAMIPKFTDENNHVLVGLCPAGGFDAYPGLWVRDGGTFKLVWLGQKIPYGTLGAVTSMKAQICSDGRWSITVEVDTSSVADQEASGSMAELITGSTIVALHDYSPTATGIVRLIKSVSVRSLAAVTPPPIPSGGSLTWHGPRLLTADESKYPYIGESGLQVRQGVDNNLTVIARRGGDAYLSAASRNTDSLNINVEGYPRYLSVPH